MERIVQAFDAAVVSTRASCGPVEEATVRFQNGVVVPMATLPSIKALRPKNKSLHIKSVRPKSFALFETGVKLFAFISKVPVCTAIVASALLPVVIVKYLAPSEERILATPTTVK